MTRRPDWERRLNEAVERHMALPPDYAITNCYILPDDCVLAITGRRMHPKLYNGGRGPKTERGAAKRLLRHGFRSVEDAFAARFPRIPPLTAQRGDIGVVEIDGVVCGGVYTAIGFAARSAHGVAFLPVTTVKSAFRVE